MPSLFLLGEEDVRILSGDLDTYVHFCWFCAMFREEALCIGRVLCSLVNKSQLESVPALLEFPLVQWLHLSSAITTSAGQYRARESKELA
jgi:hypothetical protein